MLLLCPFILNQTGENTEKLLSKYLRLQDELFTNAWSRNNQLIKLDPLQPTSVILAAAHIARGSTTLSDMKRNIERYLFFLFNIHVCVYDHLIIVFY